jgi:type I restriction enzyme, S subunit
MWETVALGDVCELRYGRELPKSERVEENGYPAYGANGVKAYAKAPLFHNRSIIVGRKGSAGELNKVEQPFWPLDVTYYVVADENKINLDFLYYVLSVQNLPSMARGVKPGINRNDVYSISILLPQIAEQKRIVAKLDTAFAEIDRAIEIEKQKLAEQKRFFGELIDSEIRHLRSEFGPCELHDLIESVEYGTATKCKAEGRYPVLRMGNMQAGRFDFEDLVYLDDEEELERYRVRKGDVFFNRTNSALHVGKAAYFDEDDTEFLFAGYLIRVNYRPERLNGKFLNYILNAPSTRQYGYTVMTSSVNQSNINGTKLKSYPFVNADIGTQNRLAKKFIEIDGHVQAANDVVEETLNQYSALKSAILLQELRSEAA